MNRKKILYCIWRDGERRHLFGYVGLAVVENVDSDDNGELRAVLGSGPVQYKTLALATPIGRRPSEEARIIMDRL